MTSGVVGGLGGVGGGSVLGLVISVSVVVRFGEGMVWDALIRISVLGPPLFRFCLCAVEENGCCCCARPPRAIHVAA